METVTNIKKVALIFFIVTGFIHLGSSIFISNSIFLKEALIINKTMDIPFIITGLIYGLASLRISLSDPQKDHKILDIALISITVLALVGMIIINLAVPNIS